MRLDPGEFPAKLVENRIRETLMVFLITALDTSGAVTLRRESALAAMKKADELISEGCWDVDIVTPDGVTYHSDEFDRLREQASGRPALSAAVDAQHLS